MTSAVDPPSNALPREGLSFLLRFKLRTLFVFAILFCLFVAWMCKRYERVRQEDAAIETILQGGGTMWLVHDPSSLAAPPRMPSPEDVSVEERFAEDLKRSIGWSARPRIGSVELRNADPQDPAAPASLAALAFIKEVQGVTLNGQAFDDESIQALASLPKLDRLTLANTSATAAGLAAIPAPERIRSLTCYGLTGGQGLLTGVGPLRELRSIHLAHADVTQAEIEAVASLPKLHTLSLTMARLRSEPMASPPARDAPRLPIVQPWGESVLDPLAQSESLRELRISRGDRDFWKEAHLRALTRPPNLERLSIATLSTRELRLIEPGPRLKILELPDFSPRPTAEAFSAEHPACEVRLSDATGLLVSFRAGRPFEPFKPESFP